MSALVYYIKTNPFYISYPVMLPIMSFTLVGYLIYYFNYIKKLQNVVSEIWLDKSGYECRIVYNNMRYRKMRGKQVEEIVLNGSLVSPSKQSFEYEDCMFI